MPIDNSTNDWGNILSGLAGVGGNIYANNQASSGANNATNMAQFKGVNVGMPGGQVSGQNNGGQLNYNVNSPLTQNANQFQGLATAFGNNAQSGAAGNPYLTAGNKALDQFSQFDPQQFANQQYQNLSAMAAPGNTDQTQAMLNYEHATGRGGVTQNGQLGDLGGLALAQSTADNGRRLQAQQLGMQQQNTLATNAQNLLQSGLGMNSSNLTNSLNASQGSLGINQQLMQLLQTAVGGQAQQANAGANAGKYQYLNGVNQANSTGNLMGGLLQGGANGSGLQGMINSGKNLYNGYQSLFGGSGMGASAGTMADLGSGLGASTGSAMSGVAGDVAAANDAWLGGGGFSAAGGGAAGAGGLSGLSSVTGSLDAGLNGVAGSAASSLGSSAGTGALGGSAGEGAAAGSLGLGLAGVGLAAAPAIYGASRNPVDLHKSYWQGMDKTLQVGKSDPQYWNTVSQLLGMQSQDPINSPEAQQMLDKYGISFYQNPNVTQGAAVSRVSSRSTQRY